MLHRYRDVFASLHSNNCRYIVLGGVAAEVYGVPSMTFFIDILIDASEANAEKLLSALHEAGYFTARLLTAKGLLANEITIFTERARVHVQTSTPGLVFEEAWRQRRTIVFEDVPIDIVSADDFIKSKPEEGRRVDLADLERLRLKK